MSKIYGCWEKVTSVPYCQVRTIGSSYFIALVFYQRTYSFITYEKNPRILWFFNWIEAIDHHCCWKFGNNCYLSYRDRKSTRLNSSHQIISYAVFCLKKKICRPSIPHV